MITVVFTITFIVGLFIPIIFCRIAQTGTFYSVFDYSKHTTVLTSPEFKTRFPSLVKLWLVIAGFHGVFFILTGGFGIILYPVTGFISTLIFIHEYSQLFIEITGMNPDVDEYVPDEQIDELQSLLSNTDTDNPEDL